jgi:hypothetical protein
MDFPGEKLVIRLWETIAEKGMGSLLKPWQERRERRALLEMRQEEIVGVAQAEKYADDIRSGRMSLKYDEKHKPMLVCDDQLDVLGVGEGLEALERKLPLFSTLQANLLADHLRKEANVAKAIIHAETELGNDPQEPPAETVNEDWLFRWRDSASQVSSDELQQLWGKLLAGEIKSPGSFSLRTLEFIRNLSSAEAASIAKLARFVVSDGVSDVICRHKMDILKAEGLDLDFLYEMQHLGVIAGVEAPKLVYRWDSIQEGTYTNVLCSNGRALVVRGPDATKKPSLAVFQLTKIGKQIIGLGKFEPHEKYLRNIGSLIVSQGFTVSIANYASISSQSLQIIDEESLSA